MSRVLDVSGEADEFRLLKPVWQQQIVSMQAVDDVSTSPAR